MVAIIALESFDGRGSGTEHTHSFVTRFFEPAAQRARPLEHIIQFAAANHYVGERAVRWIVHPAAKTKFFVVKSREIMVRCILDRIMIGKICLQNYFPGSISSTGPASDLGEQLKGAFGGAEIG